MDTANQQKILGYFIEEAKEHLETLEKGILELPSVIEDSERVNEMFRAAHSVKGGAAMLGYGSIQKTAHRLEDAFKILKENPIPVDEQLESLFLGGYDVLQDLVERLQGSLSLPEEEAAAIMERAEPKFKELQDYLKQLLGQGKAAPSVEEAKPVAVSPEFSAQVKNLLIHMLQLFKQPPTPQSRQQLQQICAKLAQLAPNQVNWQNLTKMAGTAIANPKNAYSVLAPVVIKELKGSADLVQVGKDAQVAPSQGLQQLGAAQTSQAAQMLITLEPKAVAVALRKAFNREQIAQVVALLSQET